ncbi:MAG: YdcF family protein [Patescibacteria group bacterium]
MGNKWQKFLYFFGSFLIILFLAIEITPFNDLLAQPLVKKDGRQKSDVIIVLGGGIKKDGTLNKQTQERVKMGVVLSQEEYAPYLLLAGGQAKNRLWTESDIMTGYALSIGADPLKILKESASKNTYENAVNSLAIMANRGDKNALVVTSPYHTKRACAIFEKLTAEIYCQPVNKSLLFRQGPWDKIIYFKQMIREYGAIILFKIKGYI